MKIVRMGNSTITIAFFILSNMTFAANTTEAIGYTMRRERESSKHFLRCQRRNIGPYDSLCTDAGPKRLNRRDCRGSKIGQIIRKLDANCSPVTNRRCSQNSKLGKNSLHYEKENSRHSLPWNLERGERQCE